MWKLIVSILITGVTSQKWELCLFQISDTWRSVSLVLLDINYITYIYIQYYYTVTPHLWLALLGLTNPWPQIRHKHLFKSIQPMGFIYTNTWKGQHRDKSPNQKQKVLDWEAARPASSPKTKSLSHRKWILRRDTIVTLVWSPSSVLTIRCCC